MLMGKINTKFISRTCCCFLALKLSAITINDDTEPIKPTGNPIKYVQIKLPIPLTLIICKSSNICLITRTKKQTHATIVFGLIFFQKGDVLLLIIYSIRELNLNIFFICWKNYKNKSLQISAA